MIGSYILLFYSNKDRTDLIGFRLFSRIKDCIKFTSGLIKYADLNKPLGKYHTYKNYIALLELSNYHTWKYFNCRDLLIRCPTAQ